MPNGDESFFSNEQEEEAGQQQSMMARVAIMMRIRKTREKIKQKQKEREQAQEELDAQEQKKMTCFGLMTLAISDDLSDVFIAAGSFGLLQSITFFIPVLIRFIVATKEREQRPDRWLRAILAAVIEAIPYVNLLPSTTINLIIDWGEAFWDAEQAKKKVESLEKEIKSLQQSDQQMGRSMSRIPSAA